MDTLDEAAAPLLNKDSCKDDDTEEHLTIDELFRAVYSTRPIACLLCDEEVEERNLLAHICQLHFGGYMPYKCSSGKCDFWAANRRMLTEVHLREEVTHLDGVFNPRLVGKRNGPIEFFIDLINQHALLASYGGEQAQEAILQSLSDMTNWLRSHRLTDNGHGFDGNEYDADGESVSAPTENVAQQSTSLTVVAMDLDNHDFHMNTKGDMALQEAESAVAQAVQMDQQTQTLQKVKDQMATTSKLDTQCVAISSVPLATSSAQKSATIIQRPPVADAAKIQVTMNAPQPLTNKSQAPVATNDPVTPATKSSLASHCQESNTNIQARKTTAEAGKAIYRARKSIIDPVAPPSKNSPNGDVPRTQARFLQNRACKSIASRSNSPPKKSLRPSEVQVVSAGGLELEKDSSRDKESNTTSSSVGSASSGVSGQSNAANDRRSLLPSSVLCQFCTFVGLNSGHLVDHYKRSHLGGYVPFKCTVKDTCGFATWRMRDMRNHMLEKHGQPTSIAMPLAEMDENQKVHLAKAIESLEAKGISCEEFKHL